jgi:hypothetical protein
MAAAATMTAAAGEVAGKQKRALHGGRRAGVARKGEAARQKGNRGDRDYDDRDQESDDAAVRAVVTDGNTLSLERWEARMCEVRACDWWLCDWARCVRASGLCATY